MDAGELARLRAVLLEPAEAGAHETPRGETDAAVLIPILGWPDRPSIVFTERRHDLRRHAGEISFPGGRQDPEDASLPHTALREASEEIALDPGHVEVVGALPAIGTFVTGYRVHPFVGVTSAEASMRPNPDEVETLLTFEIEALRESFRMRRLIRRGVPFRTPTYEIERHMIWGATARILAELLERLTVSTDAGTDA